METTMPKGTFDKEAYWEAARESGQGSRFFAVSTELEGTGGFVWFKDFQDAQNYYFKEVETVSNLKARVRMVAIDLSNEITSILDEMLDEIENTLPAIWEANSLTTADERDHMETESTDDAREDIGFKFETGQ